MNQLDYEQELAKLNAMYCERRNAISNKYELKRQNIIEVSTQEEAERNKERNLLLQKIEEIMQRRNEMKRQGLQPFSIEMEKNYKEERDIQEEMRSINHLKKLQQLSWKKMRSQMQIDMNAEYAELKKEINDKKSQLGQLYKSSIIKSRIVENL